MNTFLPDQHCFSKTSKVSMSFVSKSFSLLTLTGQQSRPFGPHPRLCTFKQCMWPSLWEADVAHGSSSGLPCVCEQQRPEKHPQKPASECELIVSHLKDNLVGSFEFLISCQSASIWPRMMWLKKMCNRHSEKILPNCSHNWWDYQYHLNDSWCWSRCWLLH